VTRKEIASKLNYLSIDDDDILKQWILTQDPLVTRLTEASKEFENGDQSPVNGLIEINLGTEEDPNQHLLVLFYWKS